MIENEANKKKPDSIVNLLDNFKTAFEDVLDTSTMFHCPVCGNDTLRSEWGEHDNTAACPRCGLISPKYRVSTVFKIANATFPEDLRDHAQGVFDGISKIQRALGKRLQRYGVFDGKDGEQQALISLQIALSLQKEVAMWLKRLLPQVPFTDKHISDIIAALLERG